MPFLKLADSMIRTFIQDGVAEVHQDNAAQGLNRDLANPIKTRTRRVPKRVDHVEFSIRHYHVEDIQLKYSPPILYKIYRDYCSY